MPDNKRLALAGVGGWGRNVARSLRRLRGAALVAVCDPDRGALDRFEDPGPGVRRVGPFEDVLADDSIDAIVVATPPDTHHRLARAALGAGKDVLVEKPLTVRSDDAADLVSAAETAKKILMVGHLLLYHPAIQKLEMLLRDGELGDIRYLYTQRVNLGVVRSNENSLWSLAPHDVALAIALLGEPPERVTAQGAAYLRPGVEDIVFTQLFFPSGRMASVHVSWLDPHKERRLTVVGSRRMAVFDDMEPTEKLRIYDRGIDVPDYLPYGDALALRFGDVWIPSLEPGEPLVLECQHFIDRLHDRKPPRSDGRAGLEVVRVLAAASESLRRGGTPIPVR